MKKRIRKKKHLKEFKEMGVPVVIKRNQEEEFDSFLDDFIEYAIEGNNCLFGGSGKKHKLSGYIELGTSQDDFESKISAIKRWLDNRDDIEKYVFGVVTDLWYGTFEELDEIETKNQQGFAVDR